ncbi:MAG: DUF4394 domain-containing protein, partial [Verrucomicrobiaceae bacterium]
TTLSGTNFGVDFNPSADRLRVVTSTGLNLRINVDTGRVLTDGVLNNGGPDPLPFELAGSAYTNSFAGNTGTALYNIDVSSDRLVVQNPPNNGTITTIGTGLGIGDVTGVGGFEIYAGRTADGTITNVGYATLTVNGIAKLYLIDLTTGLAETVATVGDGSTQLRGLTALTDAPGAAAFVIDQSNALLRINTATPNSATTIGTITGLVGTGEVIVGFDFRPANGLLYLVTKDVNNAGHLYTLNTATAQATFVGLLVADGADTTDLYQTLNGTEFGVDFNPAADRLRIVSNTGQSLRIDVSTLGVFTDGNLNGPATGASATAYRNNAAGAAITTLFNLDATTDQLFTQDPTSGALTVRGSLGVDATSISGFDIRTNGEAYATLVVNNISGLYSINLTTGQASYIGEVGGAGVANAGFTTRGLAISPDSTILFENTAISVSEGGQVATVTLKRVGSTSSPVTVLVKASDGTANAGSDYTTITRWVTFGTNSDTATFEIPISDDTVFESNETILLTLTDTSPNATITGANVATLTIIENEAQPTLSISDISRAEGSVDNAYTFTVTLSGLNSTAVSFHYATADDSAEAGSDYVAIEGDITIPAGQTSATVTVTVKGDTIVEANESFSVVLTSVTGGVALADGTGLGTILNDDATLVNPKTLTYSDGDGDLVTLKISGKGTLD